MNRKLSAVEVAQLLKDVGFHGWQVVRFGQITMAESARNTHAVNGVHNPESPAHGSLDLGLLQINSYWARGFYHNLADLLDPEVSVYVARAIFLARQGETNPIDGYRAWTTYPQVSTYPYPWQAECIEAARAVGEWS